jgi:hypothetical protein
MRNWSSHIWDTEDDDSESEPELEECKPEPAQVAPKLVGVFLLQTEPQAAGSGKVEFTAISTVQKGDRESPITVNEI